MKLFSYYRSPGFFWLRILGRGISIKDLRKREPCFSERYGYNRTFKIGNYLITLLPKDKIAK